MVQIELSEEIVRHMPELRALLLEVLEVETVSDGEAIAAAIMAQLEELRRMRASSPRRGGRVVGDAAERPQQP